MVVAASFETPVAHFFLFLAALTASAPHTGIGGFFSLRRLSPAFLAYGPRPPRASASVRSAQGNLPPSPSLGPSAAQRALPAPAPSLLGTEPQLSCIGHAKPQVPAPHTGRCFPIAPRNREHETTKFAVSVR